MINKNSPIPLYYQLKKKIENIIKSGKLKPGDAIPTEIEFMKRYAVSRTTVRNAILQMVNEGYLRRVIGKGTFIKTHPIKSKILGNLIGFSKEMEQKGISHFTKVLGKDIVLAPIRVADMFQITTNDLVFYLKRLRFVEGKPIIIVENYVPAYLCPGIEKEDFKNGSLYNLLKTKFGLNIHHGRREFEPINSLSKEEIELLEVSPGTPLLYVESVTFTENNVPIEYFQSKILGKFTIDLISR